MTDAELDATDMKIFQEESRLRRIAMGSGRPAREVGNLMQEFKKMSMMWGKMKGLKGFSGKGGMSALTQRQNINQMTKMLPPGLLNQMGGAGALQNLMRQMESGGGFPGGFPGLG